jgi:hypothetical protein
MTYSQRTVRCQWSNETEPRRPEWLEATSGPCLIKYRNPSWIPSVSRRQMNNDEVDSRDKTLAPADAKSDMPQFRSAH